MLKPLIGLTTSRIKKQTPPWAFGANEPYSKSISAAGGLPVLVPSYLSNEDLDSLISRLDGILFTGGYDIDPHCYGNPFHPKVVGIDTERDRVEIYLVKQAIRNRKPFLGICRGFQVINVALGGTLYEDLPEQFEGVLHHDNHHQARNYLAHTVKLQPNNQLAGIFAVNDIQVNSLHHQGIKRLATELEAVGRAPDDLIEAVEVPSYPFGMAVQWHPEELQEQESMRRLLQVFAHNCSI